MPPDLKRIFQETYRELRPRAQMPGFDIRFYAFASINNTIRLRQDRLLVRISDLLEGAPETVLRAILHILLAKIYRKEIEPGQAVRYRRYITSHDFSAKAHVVRQMRGRKQLNGASGRVYDLQEIFDHLNRRFFHGLLGRPELTWSRDHARNNLGHYDPAHNTIVVSRAFDRPTVPRYAVEYLVYHEMLHLLYPVRAKSGRRCVHPKAFRDREKTEFPDYDRAIAFLKFL